MKKRNAEQERKDVTKKGKMKAIWKKRIVQETGLSEKTAEWMAERVEALTDYMQYGCALIAYRKQNGDFYLVRGTLISYRNDFHKEYDIEHIENHVVYWDIEQQGWRTFQLENFLEWRPIVG